MRDRASKFVVLIALLAPALVVLPGCGKKPAAQAAVDSGEDEFGIGSGTKPQEKVYLLAAKPFVAALASANYAEVYAQLSSHGRARMSLNQFVPTTDEAAYQKNEESAFTDVSLGKFVELMGLVEKELGRPAKVKMVSVHSTDADVLNRRGKEQSSSLDSMLAIGAMPDSIPADIRKASLRGQIHTTLSAEKLAQVARQEGITVEALKKDPDFDPYLNFKIVLVEENAQFKVAYFEFLPPSMLD